MRRHASIWILTAFLVGIPASGSAHEDGSFDNTIIKMVPTGYTPSTITITQNTTIVFENTSDTDLWPASNIHPTHEIYSDFDPKHPVKPGESWSFTFTRPGAWTFHDHMFPTVTGTITVTQSAWTAPPWLKKVFTTLVHTFQKPAPLNYILDSNIRVSSTDVYHDINALYSYITVYGLPTALQHMQALSAKLGSCHDPAHRAGRIAYELYEDQAFTKCSAECHSGCYHGATEVFFRTNGTENLTQNLATICSSDLNPFMSHQCLHGIGHGLMAWANYEIHDALEACDLLPRDRASCYTGVFMENVVGSLEENSNGHYTKYLSDDPHFPCSVVEEKYAAACYFYQSSRMLQLFGQDWPRLAATCQSAPARFHQHCFESLGRDVGGVFATDVAGAIKACGAINDASNRLFCLNGAVQNYFWEPSGQAAALSFCATLQMATEKESCYTTIAQRAALVLPTTTAKARFCYNVEAPWQSRCVAIVYP